MQNLGLRTIPVGENRSGCRFGKKNLMWQKKSLRLLLKGISDSFLFIGYDLF